MAIVNLTAGGMSGGYRKYLRKLLPLLREKDPSLALSVFVPDERRNELSIPNTEFRTWPAGKSGSNQNFLRKQVVALRPDVVLIPSARWLDLDGIPTIVMVRNMEPLTVPCEGLPWRERLVNLARAWEARRACRRATRVVAVSRHVQDYLEGYWGILAEKIGLVYHGIDPVQTGAMQRPKKAEGIASFLFTAGSIRPARGLDDLVQALAVLRRQGLKPKLFLAGQPDPSTYACKSRLERAAEEAGVASQLIWAGQLSEAEMCWCYKHAEAFVMTSRAEACPNVVLESLACGARCISTDQPPMPEFYADAAVYYRGRNGTDLAEKIATVLPSMDSISAQSFRQAAEKRAADFTWNKTATLTLAQLRLALSGTPKQPVGDGVSPR